MKKKQTTNVQQKQGTAACFREAKRKQKSATSAFNPIALLSRSGDTESPQAKLEVSSQAELFYLFLDSVMSAGDYDGGDTLVAYMQPPEASP